MLIDPLRATFPTHLALTMMVVMVMKVIKINEVSHFIIQLMHTT